MSKLVDGRALRNEIISKLKVKVAKLNCKPKLAIVLVGDDEASRRYIKQKQKAATEIGAEAILINFPKSVSQQELERKISELNQDESVTGVIIQLPLPNSLDTNPILQKINPKKDVDGLTENSTFKPATPLGIMEILHYYKVAIARKIAVVVGQSNLVGKPLSDMLEEEGATVIRIDINTPPPINSLVQQGDIVVSAVGKVGLVQAGMVKQRAVVIDVGTNKDPETGKLVGDVDFDTVSQKASLITPVPGGVGPMTVAMLLTNLVEAASKHNQ